MPETKDYIPVSSIARSTCQSLVNMYLGEVMISGKSQISEGCVESGECPYIVKYKPLYSQDELIKFLQEMYFAQYVNVEFQILKEKHPSELYSIPNVTPHVHDTWICNDEGTMGGFIVMDRMDMSLAEFIRVNALQDHHVDYIRAYLEKLFQVLIRMGVWHRNLTLDNVVVQGAFPKLNLYIIDWDDIVWNQDDEAAMTQRYVRLMRELTGRMKREIGRAKKIAIPLRRPIYKEPLYNPAQTFKPITDDEKEVSAVREMITLSPSNPYSQYSSPVTVPYSVPILTSALDRSAI
jgi:hypothetical protein